MYIYSQYKIPDLKGLRITLEDIEPLIKQLEKSVFTTKTIGFSMENRPIYQIKFGNGPIKIMMWSQMHGNESTATKSLFDLFNIVNINRFTNVINNIFDKCTVFCIPMLNPDGSFYYTRENALHYDLNRDAKTVLNKESKILWQQIEEIQPDFAFNLHDQTAFYNVGGTAEIASISLLAPAFDEERNLSDARKQAMSVIVGINEMLQNIIPNQVGRYNDTYCDSCFGDSIQNKGIPTILIESGYFLNDEQREKTRMVHTEILMKVLQNIAQNYFPDYQLYFKIPRNDKKYYDFKINNVIYQNQTVNLAVRMKTIFQDNKIIKIIDTEETLVIGEEHDLLFYQYMDAKGNNFDDLLIKI